ncbi:MAG: hypothetical protein AAFY11_13060 [Cyanobacteria bacterium J06641_5]
MTTTTFSIDIFTDEADGLANVGAGLSLRDAIIMALQNPVEEFVIELESSQTYALTLSGSNEDLSESGDLDITNGVNITIRSNGEAPAIIDAGYLGDSGFEIFAGSSLTLEGIQIIGDDDLELEVDVLGRGGSLTLANSAIASITGTYSSITASDSSTIGDGTGTVNLDADTILIDDATVSNNGARAITISATDLSILNGATVINSTGDLTDSAGAITINADTLVLNDEASLGAEIGSGGTISIDTGDIDFILAPSPVNLNVDGVGDVVSSVDILNIFRVYAGAPQAIAIPEGANVSQQAIAATVEAFPELSLDVDGSGDLVASIDVLNIFRVLAGAPQAVVIPEGVEASQQEVVNAVNALFA